MKKQPTDYSKGLIYKICCNDENIKDIYIGSTVDFKTRKGSHKSSCHNEKDKEYTHYKYKFIRDNGGWSNWTMIELYKYPCINKRELEQEEDRMMIELNSTLNKHRAFRTEEEIKVYNKKYKIENRDKIIIRDKKYKIEYYVNNRETIKKKNAEYSAKNRETINMKKREKIKCIKCGCVTTRSNEQKHMKSNKCINYNKPPPDTLDNNKE